MADDVPEPELAAAVQHHVVAVVPRAAATTEQLTSAVRIAASGGDVMSPAQVGDLLKRVQRLQREAIAPLGVNWAGLTRREVDVLRLMADGLGVAEIATVLCYSERTVKYVIQGVMSRLSLRNRLQAVVYAMQGGPDLTGFGQTPRGYPRAMNMGSEIGFDIDFDDSAARRVRHYVRQVVTGLGLRGDSSCIDAEPRVGAYVALDGRLPDFPEHYVALVWNELAGWSVAVENRLGELVEVARMGGDPRPAPAAVVRWTNSLLGRDDVAGFLPLQRGA
ncbi:DUF6292 family protein [Lentzea sp. HUAS TT2]|uniref:DUF6292 family protein n=1 Tax=Lentzea sp. HUAS TT2 TaxID=3447454 RepID=UPI003F6FF2B1